MNNALIYGKDSTQRIVGSEVIDGKRINYIADGNKTITQATDFYYYAITEDYDDQQRCGRLAGKNDLQYFVKFKEKSDLYNYTKRLEYNNKRYWKCYNPVESAMLREGYTYYKGMKLSDVSVLSFDIETTGVKLDKNSFVLLISNTYRDRSGNITRKLFSFSDYDTPKEFLDAWCMWAREMDPDIITGHNIFGFDFPYLQHYAKMSKTKLHLGRNASAIEIDRNPRQFRKDGSQTYDYHNVKIFGREIVDTFFLSIKYDLGRNYPSYGLKAIIKYENLEKEGRQHWDFSKNKEPWNNPADWTKFKQYAIDDADDALSLVDLMLPSFFYYAQSIPKPFQEIINTATGSQFNAFMLRAYLQESKAIPLADEKGAFEGAISIGNPGLYKNVFKVDVASLYPSIMLTYKITNEKKDPEGKFLEAVKFFTEERLVNKQLAKDTSERYYLDMSNSQKIVINSAYGFMGAPGLNFNYPKGASEVTRIGREILTTCIQWCENKGFKLVNADTDSISYEAPEDSYIDEHLAEINRLYTKGISWENDGVYDSVLVVKAKNYALKTGNKVKIKGSALKATMKEPALSQFLADSIELMLNHKIEEVATLYTRLALQINDIRDIAPWCSKKTVTKAVLTSPRANETRVLDALAGENIQEGDKVRLFFETAKTLCLDKNFKGKYCKDTLYAKLFATVKIFATVLDMSKFPNYKLKKNKQLLEKL